ncbi:2OG-Fe(II) oxygenase family protein [Streptosporangium sp. NPDC000239]|uniref:2-oxoglutarate and iron-dependent oxygenase domain-containing protein n=1 Tax=Streptosporangium jomthongense TaxID=1193683 RepID=A0ABV8FCS5_9ACTN
MPHKTLDYARELLGVGYARITLGAKEAALLATALDECRRFFSLPDATKARYSSADCNFGYRPLGMEYSITADRPDLNDCFTLWSDRLDLVPNSAELTSLTDALLAWRNHLSALVSDVVGHVAGIIGDAQAPSFEAASYLQVNNYTHADGERDLLQDRHEDGHLVTVIHTTAPGLEIWPDGECLPVEMAPDEVVLMPGSVFAELTGGKVGALDHQVRNLGLDRRMSLMYFVNPELTEPLYPWVRTEGEAPADLRDKIRSHPATFGLPHVPVL